MFLPFSTNVLACWPVGQPIRTSIALYIGTLIVTSASMLLMEVVLKRNPGLLREGVEGGLRLTSSVIATVLFAVSLVLAVLVPSVGMLWLLILLLSGPIEALYDRWSQRGSASPTP